MKRSTAFVIAFLIPASVSGGIPGDLIFANRFELARLPNVGDIVITEIMADPAMVPDAVGEWFEIVNANPANAVDIGDCVLSNGTVSSQINGFLPIFGSDRVVFARSTNPAMNGGVPADLSFGFGLLQVNGQLSISCFGVLLDSTTWTSSTAGRSRSLAPEATDPVANDNPANWCLSSSPFNGTDLGTPGTVNETCP